MALIAALFAVLSASATLADLSAKAISADVVFLGEQHDNAAHHKVQAEWVAQLKSKALVFEMLTTAQAARATFDVRDTQQNLEDALGWSETAWPNFGLYYPIFAAAPDALIYGAGVLRQDISVQLETPLAQQQNAAIFGLDRPTDQEEQALREDLQDQAHCGALPSDLLPMMVDAQRLRDMALADAALRALKHTGGPVVVITGNGHARPDWGAPALLAFAAPNVQIFALGQTEGGREMPTGFDHLIDALAPKRGDPCAAFSK